MSAVNPVPGEIVDGYRFNGGDPASEASWTQVDEFASLQPGQVVDDYEYLGGDPADQASWRQPTPSNPLMDVLGSGFTRGLTGTADVLSSPVTMGLQAAGLPISDQPLTALATRAGLVREPVTPVQERLQAIGGALGGAVIPGALPLGMAARGAGMAAPAVRAAAAAPATFAGTEAAGALAAGMGAELGRAQGGEPGALLGGIAGGLAMPGIVAGARGGLRGAARGREALAENLAAFERAGVRPTAGQVTQNPVQMMLEKAMAVTPGGYLARRRVLADQTEQAANRVQAMIGELGGAADPTQAGTALSRGVEGFVESFKRRAGEMYSQADELIPAETTSNLSRFRQTIDEIVGRAPETAALRRSVASDRIGRIASALEETPGEVPYAAMREFRTALGDMLAGGGLVADAPRGQLKRLYGALAEDMSDALADNPQALRAQRRADRFYRAGLGRVEDVLQPLVGTNRKTVEQVFSSLEGLYRSPSALAKVKRSVKPQQWKQVAGLAIDKLGRATPGRQSAEGDVFSFQTFLTNWNRMPKSAKRHLFGTRHTNDLNAMAKTADLIAREAEVIPNPSGTAAATMAGALLMSPWTSAGVMPTIGGTVGTYGAMRLLNSRPFMAWLAQSTRLPVAQMPAHVERLASVAAQVDPDERSAIQDYLDAIMAETGVDTLGGP